MEERVILVNERDEVLGTAGKLQAHWQGRLHRALSVFVFDKGGRLLLQQRASDKYHSGGLWSNTCCSHPRPGDDTLAAAHRRLMEEMGFDCALRFAFLFRYQARLNGDMIEHEVDHVFVGRYDADPRPDPGEVVAWRWTAIPRLLEDLRSRPQLYTTWFPLALAELDRHRPQADG